MFNKRNSIGTKIFAAFVVMSLMTGALGAYGIYVLSEAGGIVEHTYDGPLMAINFARSASLLFMQMDKEYLARTMAPASGRAEIDGKIDETTKDFFDDLAVAEERSGGVQQRKVIVQIRELANQWGAARQTGGEAINALSEKIIERFDVLIELTADQSFIERRKAVWSIRAFRYIGIGVTLFALLASALITLLLARLIVRPLSAAAAAADRIADGDLQCQIPEGGKDEAGALLRSMKMMQKSLTAMMEVMWSQRETADRANRAKSEFLSNMSHELRTPLNSILGFAQLMEYDPDQQLSERHLQYVGHIRDSGDHLLMLIDEVLDLSKIEAGSIAVNLEPVPLNPLLERAHVALSPMAERAGVFIERQPTGEALIVKADGTRLLQVLMNLGNNALKYNRAGGKLTLAAERVDKITIRISVADTGIGIPLERQGEVFQAFNRLGAEYGAIEGTGIGLNITQRLVQLMGGQIGFNSAPGIGTTFWVDLTAWEGAAVSPPPPQETRALKAADAGFTLLYVEDNSANIELMRGLAEALDGVTLLTAEHPAIGLTLAADRRPDVIVLDIDLPDMNGFEVLARLKADPQTCDIPVIALTAAAMPHDIERGLDAGFNHYLTKPINVPDFFAKIADVLAERRVA